MTVNITIESEKKFDFDYEDLLNRVIEAACDYEDCPYETSVDVLITDSEGIHEINREARGIDAPTDVLSFPNAQYHSPSDFSHLEDEDSIDCFDPDSGELMLGDIVLNTDRIESQALAYGHSERREMAFLTAHSMLHLFGYDHEEDAEREEMERRQEEILTGLGITRD
ncbi:MAG: rRNA maturation RNase YbeY [Lachnospiraceae bacterium]|nr:rRNA maturation RNase YbeY [Lachnospiraceae bacterium]